MVHPTRIMIVTACLVAGAVLISRTMQAKVLAAGSVAPSFVLRDYKGQEFSLTKALQSGRWVVLVFYPQDDSPICTKQLCKIRDMLPTIPAHITVWGINHGDASSHRAFIEKHKLPFPVLIDAHDHVRKAYGANVWGNRVTFTHLTQNFLSCFKSHKA